MQVWDVSKLLDGSGAEAVEGKAPRLRATAAVAAHDKDINALAVSPNDALICTASQDRTAKVSHHKHITHVLPNCPSMNMLDPILDLYHYTIVLPAYFSGWYAAA